MRRPTVREDWNLKGLDDMIFKQFTLKLQWRSRGGADLPADRGEDHRSVKGHLRAKEAHSAPLSWSILIKMIMLSSPSITTGRTISWGWTT
jgi:hypothetical protein